MAKQTKSKNQLRREKAKLKKQEEREAPEADEVVQEQRQGAKEDVKEIKGSLFTSSIDDLTSLPEFSQFQKVFDRFHSEEAVPEEDPAKGTIIESDNDNDGDEEDEQKQNESRPGKRKLRKMNKISLVELKSRAKNEELVQWYDVDAVDPILVVELKSQKNYIPVPSHWQQKREYLSSRRAMDKKAFELPTFITDTGITNMRDTTQEDDSTMKQRMREQVQPKMNRLDLDYQKLHDAFFKFQTKPKMLGYGDLFFEGKTTEEIDYTQFRPGHISAVLKHALNLPAGVALPWIQKMHQLGPPPSYRDALYPGYNAPLEDDGVETEVVGVEREMFGKLLVVDESEDEEEEEDDEQEDEDDNKMPQYEDDEDEAVVFEEEEITQNLVPEQPSDEDIELPEIQSREQEKEQIAPKKLYDILKERAITGSGLMVNAHSYEIPSEDGTGKRKNSGADENPAKKKKVVEEDDDDEEDSGKFKF